MSRPSSFFIAVVLVSGAATGAQAQHQHQQGPMMGMAGGMRCMGRDSATTAQLRVIHDLVVNHDRITRTVTHLPNGIQTITESDDPRLTVLLREHVVNMSDRVQRGDDPGLPTESPALRELFRNRGSIRTAMEPTQRGVVLVQTSSDPRVVAALQQHAAEVSDMAARGMPAMREAMMKHSGAVREGMCMGTHGAATSTAAPMR